MQVAEVGRETVVEVVHFIPGQLKAMTPENWTIIRDELLKEFECQPKDAKSQESPFC
jgi:predicted Co/Zn/Cd cation transporter (cation efflux family)